MMDELKPCPFCGSIDLKCNVYLCDRKGWDKGWEPSIVCACGIGFLSGYYGGGVDPDWVENRIISAWNTRACECGSVPIIANKELKPKGE